MKKILITMCLVVCAATSFAQQASEQDAFSTAQASYEQEAYGVSTDLFKKFIETFPQSKLIPEAQYFLAESYYKQDKFIEARETLTQLESTYVPLNIEAKFFYLFGQLYLKIKDTKLAAEYFNKLKDRYPHSELVIQAQVQLGRILMQEEKYEQARDVFDKLTIAKDVAIQEEAMFEKGQALYALKNYTDLLDTYEMFLKVFPESKKVPRILFYLGEASFYREKFDKALAYYQQALIKSTDDAMSVLALLGEGWSFIKLNQPQDAEEAFSKIENFSNVDFNKESFFFGKAMAYFSLGQLDNALSNYDALLSTYPQSSLAAQALFGKAQCLTDLFRFEEAIPIYAKLLENLAPQNASDSSVDQSMKDLVNKTRFNLLWAYIKTKNPQAAFEEFQKTDKNFGDTKLRVSALCQIGDLYQESQQWPKAIEVYTFILKEYPKNSYRDYCLFQLGLAYLRSSQLDFSIETFKTFNEEFSESTLLDDANYYLGYAYYQKADYKTTSTHYINFLQVFPHSEYKDSVLYLLAVALYEQGNYKDAIGYFEKFKKTLGQNKDMIEKADYDIAYALYQTGNNEEAVRRFRQFIEDYPQSLMTPQVLFWMGNYYYQNNQPAFARKYFEQLIRMYPQHSLIHEAWYILGVMSVAAGEVDSAIETLTRLSNEQTAPGLKIKTLLLLGDLFSQKEESKQAIKYYNDSLAFALEQFNNFTSTPVVSQASSEGTLNNSFSSQEALSQEGIKKYIEAAYLRLAEVFKQYNDLDSAIDAYDKARLYAATVSEAYLQFKIGECYEEKNDIAQALHYYTLSSSQNDKDLQWVTKALLRAARIHQEHSEWKEALVLYEKIKHSKVPENKYADEQIAIVRQQIENSQKKTNE